MSLLSATGYLANVHAFSAQSAVWLQVKSFHIFAEPWEEFHSKTEFLLLVFDSVRPTVIYQSG